jgi:biopolymer transport protein ExbD
VTISVNRQAQWLVAGNVVDVPALKDVLSDLVERQGSAAAIRIRTDGAVQYRYVEPILREAALKGITDAAIAVRERDAQ